jgi:hypothetical protein
VYQKQLYKKKSEYKKHKNGNKYTDKYSNKDKKIIVDKVPVNTSSLSAHLEQNKLVGPNVYSFSLNPLQYQPSGNAMLSNLYVEPFTGHSFPTMDSDDTMEEVD